MTKKAVDMLNNYREGIEALTGTMPESVKAYNDFTGGAFEDGEIEKAEKHRMALAIALKDGDEASITYHMDQCLGKGCSKEKIYEIMAVASAYGGGSAMSRSIIKGIPIFEELNAAKE
ncbi:carboxymuconolactone decarboxylase family protein [Salimicrobium halophilum]|uniref:Uncharacterized conserved protein YurZ, alkylhydroperoxidase/carboxymuconolactone decarboxylase family n=1 Tax=Salimicrobium halophilum TaxID=86666 RepID=A0A1G8R0X2_9BACI|nr:carboxymuconolactone decarboxylase family protein [Salimicrobium halophilum]SDJ10503.1 Uncharacterized conserved protein YurZ, alkylhydroperoxidase/carboxymuconolactone decarboxylase family [Salimicrobium halophilum]